MISGARQVLPSLQETKTEKNTGVYVHMYGHNNYIHNNNMNMQLDSKRIILSKKNIKSSHPSMCTSAGIYNYFTGMYK